MSFLTRLLPRRILRSISVVDNEQDPRMKVAVTFSDGTKLFTLVNQNNVAPHRGIAAESAKRYLEMNLTHSTLKGLLNAHRQAATENDIRKCFAIVAEIDMRLDMICEEESLLELAFLYYYLRDESPDKPSDYHTKRKRELCEKDIEAKAFFLSTAWSLSRKLSGRPVEDFLGYLEETRLVASRVQHYLRETRTSSSSSTSTNSSTTPATDDPVT